MELHQLYMLECCIVVSLLDLNTPSLFGLICILPGKKQNSYIIVRNTAIRYARVTIVKESYEADDCYGRFASTSSVLERIPQHVLDSHPQKGSEGRLIG